MSACACGTRAWPRRAPPPWSSRPRTSANRTSATSSRTACCRRHCCEAFSAAGGQLLRAPLAGLTLNADGVTLSTEAGEVRALLVIGADGAHSAVRAAAGLGADTHDYRQLAIIANVSTEKPHRHTAWQRFMHDGTLALLPLCRRWQLDRVVGG